MNFDLISFLILQFLSLYSVLWEMIPIFSINYSKITCQNIQLFDTAFFSQMKKIFIGFHFWRTFCYPLNFFVDFSMKIVSNMLNRLCEEDFHINHSVEKIILICKIILLMTKTWERSWTLLIKNLLVTFKRKELFEWFFQDESTPIVLNSSKFTLQVLKWTEKRFKKRWVQFIVWKNLIWIELFIITQNMIIVQTSDRKWNIRLLETRSRAIYYLWYNIDNSYKPTKLYL